MVLKSFGARGSPCHKDLLLPTSCCDSSRLLILHLALAVSLTIAAAMTRGISFGGATKKHQKEEKAKTKGVPRAIGISFSSRAPKIHECLV